MLARFPSNSVAGHVFTGLFYKYYPQFVEHMAQQDKDLPKYVRSEFE